MKENNPFGCFTTLATFAITLKDLQTEALYSYVLQGSTIPYACPTIAISKSITLSFESHLSSACLFYQITEVILQPKTIYLTFQILC